MRKFKRPIIKDDLLIHSSLLPGLKELSCPQNKTVYASDNANITLWYALLKKFTKDELIIISYNFFKREIVFVSVLASLEHEIVNIPITSYLCDKSTFKLIKNIKSRVSKLTLGVLKAHGDIYLSHEKIIPQTSYVLTLKSKYKYNLHSKKSTKLKVLFFALFQVLRGKSGITILKK